MGDETEDGRQRGWAGKKMVTERDPAGPLGRRAAGKEPGVQPGVGAARFW